MPKQDIPAEYNGFTREELISNLIDSCASRIQNIPMDRINQLKVHYTSDGRSYDEIEEEVLKLTERVEMLEQQINKDIDPEILDNTIILIGPMGSGKTTISNIICENNNMPHVSLDNKEQLSVLYKHQDDFKDPKEFEFFLTSKVLTNLPEPMVVDFGAGHSVYEDEVLFLEMQSLISKFNNVILLMPSEDKEESIAILNERKGIAAGSKIDSDNKHFVYMPSNYDFATNIIYTKDKTPKEISDEILKMINEKEKNIIKR